MIKYFIFLVLYLSWIDAKIYFKEEFTDDEWQKRWIPSQHPSKDWGKFVLSPGQYYGDPEISKGIQTSEDGKFYGLTTKFEPFSNKDKELVIQYSVKYEQDIKCGGAYIKLFDCSHEPKKLHSYKPYLIQFGPDICGYKKIHVIFNYEERKLAMKRQVNCKDDRFTHLYTLIIKPDNTYLIKIDNKIERRGSLEEDWDFQPPKKMKDAKITKSSDWDDKFQNVDPTDAKSPDNDHSDPQFYFTDEEQDNNDIESVIVENPANKSEWKSKPIDRLNCTGQWIQPTNGKSRHLSDLDFYKYDEICGVGFDLWQVESGTIFDNILITDDEFEAEKHGNNTWGSIIRQEKIMKIKFDKVTGKTFESPIMDPNHKHDEL